MRPRSNPITYLRFLLEADNQHGVHSPFVYSLLTKSLYVRDGSKAARSVRVWHKCLTYFRAKSVKIPQDLKAELTAPHTKCDPPYDLVFSPYPSSAEIQLLLPEIHNDSMVLVDGIRETASSLAEWNAIKAIPEVRVTLDLYSCGLLFFRREQAEEHFKIRR